ncbi:MAG: ABC-three component system protein [Phycisphaerales bacterium]
MVGRKHTDQSGAAAGRDIVGRDKVTHVYSYRESIVSSLLKKLEAERSNNQTFDGLIAELQHFRTPMEEEPVGLETKLTDGGRQDLFQNAVKEKELFAKRLARDQLWKSGQDLYAYLLGRIRDRFIASIPPMLEADATPAAIDSALVESVIEPVMNELDPSGLDLNTTHLRGMVYFLTGNCFLKWTGG